MAGKVIISCAVTGAIHTPSMSDYLPITPEEICTLATQRPANQRLTPPYSCASCR